MILPHQISSSTLLNPLTLCSDEEPLSDEELLYVPAIPIDDSQSTKEQGETERIKRLQRSVADCYRVDPQQLITDGGASNSCCGGFCSPSLATRSLVLALLTHLHPINPLCVCVCFSLSLFSMLCCLVCFLLCQLVLSIALFSFQ
eukprot:m.302630 g.302630  ORF g.302630 m.302630 type:complete len:145 (+) comp15886_c1_seq36:4557-4991(+)